MQTTHWLVSNTFAPLCLFIFATADAYSQENSSFEITREVAIQQFNGGLYHMLVDLGELPAGADGKIHLDLVNNFDFDFPVNDLTASCGCTSVSYKKDSVAADSTSRLEVILNTPKVRRKPEQSFQIRLVSGSGAQKDITLAIRYRLSGLAAFGQTIASHQINTSADRQRLTLPFVLTTPKSSKDVSIALPPNSDGITARLAQGTRSDWHVVVDIDPLFLPKQGVFTTITARDRLGETIDSMTLSLFHIEDVELSPRTFVFREAKGRLWADGILCLNEETDLPEDDRVPSIDAMLGESKLAVKCTRIGKGIYRVHVSSTIADLANRLKKTNTPPDISWHIVTASRTLGLSSRAHFSSTASLSRTP
ncbi:hypothetical protein Mal15_40910 [Stieleria maiorica]|uniref:DUF1573 domain-containing protein n=1 Tax=Stieleria maiorica TaxID=2795974 RepID=A0A5B9MFJ6_9BACT|nr:DUF1573 domain-containing protein [Stieleria maiorica]QEG00023.1 hypothetical protein Mal15_40910 [Stieleria maiorica]